MARMSKIGSMVLLLFLLGLMQAACKKPPGEEMPKGREKVKFILSDADLMEAVVVALLADHFGWDLDLVVIARHEANLDLEDLVALFALLELADNEDVDFAMGVRGEGIGWGQVAHRLGIQPGLFNKLRIRVLGPAAGLKKGKWESDKDFREGIFIIILSDYFAVEATAINERFGKGSSVTDLTLSLALGKKSHKEWTQLLEERKKSGKSWLETAQALGVDLGELDSVAQKVKNPPEKEHPLKGKGEKGKGKGKAAQ